MKTNKVTYSMKKSENRTAFAQGVHDGIPIGLGYFAVSFSLGIMARNVGFDPFQSFLVSLLCNASAGEYAGFALIGAGATYVEVAVMTLIANARYLLMSCAMSQRVRPGTGMLHRMALAFDLTDELFGIAIGRPGYLNPVYSYGAFAVALPGWSVGTALGCIAGNLMPLRIVSALSVALYGMFLAIIIPPARKNKVIAGLIAVCFAASYAAAKLPLLAGISSGTRTILLTVLLAAGAAILFPRKEEEEAA